MSRWFEAADEASFKPVAGGYVFRQPWPFGRGRAYLVNEQQKAEIAACLGRLRWQTFLAMMVLMLAGSALGSLIFATHAALRISPQGLAVLGVLVLPATVAVALLPAFFALRALQPLLARAPLATDRFTIGEQLERFASSVSPRLLWLGGAAGVIVIVANLMTIFDPFSESPRPAGFPWQVFGMLVGAVLTSYFVYLGMLRRRQNRMRSQ